MAHLQQVASDTQTIASTLPLLLLYFQIIDPFVEVEIIGLPMDCSKQQTRVVEDNGARASTLVSNT